MRRCRSARARCSICPARTRRNRTTGGVLLHSRRQAGRVGLQARIERLERLQLERRCAVRGGLSQSGLELCGQAAQQRDRTGIGRGFLGYVRRKLRDFGIESGYGGGHVVQCLFDVVDSGQNVLNPAG